MKFAYALFAAFLFGLSTPLSKILLNDLSPLMLAGVCYLGSGIMLYVLSLFQKASAESPLEKNDIPYVVGFVFCGGVIAPIMLFTGLRLINASSTSLLLNFELILTILVSWVFFREHIGLKLGISAILITLSAILLCLDIKSFKFSSGYGPLLVISACLMWAIDNNLTGKVSIKNPMNIAMIKGLCGGTINLFMAAIINQLTLNIRSLFYGTIVGFISYGLSLYFLVLAMRHIGTSRAVALFGINPFIGTVFSILLLNESLSIEIVIAFFLAGFAVFLILGEKHHHFHKHEYLEHEHLHIHDEHHEHKHLTTVPEKLPHSHKHIHVGIEHSHPHTPDAHHKHKH